MRRSPRTTPRRIRAISLEAAVARAPEVIILADHSTGTSTAGPLAPEKWERLTSVPAVKAGPPALVAGCRSSTATARAWSDGLEQLARLIHPEAFP